MVELGRHDLVFCCHSGYKYPGLLLVLWTPALKLELNGVSGEEVKYGLTGGCLWISSYEGGEVGIGIDCD